MKRLVRQRVSLSGLAGFVNLALLAISVAPTSASAAEILAIDFGQYGGAAPIETILEADGHSVDVVNGAVSGNIAAALASSNYSQVFLFDLASSGFLSGSDLTALASFWDTTMGLVIDTRSYGYEFQPTNPSEIALLQNVASQFVLAGGGVWVGTDHDPAWTNNGNAFLNAIGVDPVTGIFSDPVNFADPTSVLLAGVTPTELWGGGQSVGQAPLGVQSNGIEMFLHFGHIRQDQSVLPYISASFPLRGVDPVPEVPEPGTITLMISGLLAVALAGRRRR